MTFREFNFAMIRDGILGKLLPLEIKRSFPRLSLEDGKLCAAFIGFRVAQENRAPIAFPPVYYLKITYPQCALQSFERIPAGAAPAAGHPMTARSGEKVKRLMELCDAALKCFDEQSDGLESALSAYNALLDALLEPEQLAVLNRFSNAS